MSDVYNPAELRDVFSRKYSSVNSDWQGHSGPGSDPNYTIGYRGFLETFIRSNNIKTVVDIGCGDWQFTKYINFDGVNYLGLDVVDPVIMANQERYGGRNISFGRMPEQLSEAPQAQLLIIKDVLQHLTEQNIRSFIEIVLPKFQHCLLTNSYRRIQTPVNTPIRDGGFRCLDLSASPFNLRGAYVFSYFSPIYEEIRTYLHQPSR